MPLRYEPSGDCDGERTGIDHFVFDEEGNEVACPPNEYLARMFAAAPDMLTACQLARIVIKSPNLRDLLDKAISKATGEGK